MEHVVNKYYKKYIHKYISLTEHNSVTIQKLLFGVNTTIQLKNVTTPDSNDI